MKVTASTTLTHNPCGEAYGASGLRENLTSRSYGEGLETGRATTQALRQSLTRQTNFAHLKTTMGLDVLKCKTVDGVLKELIVFALIYNLVRMVMIQAARRQQVPLERISFIDAVRWLAAARTEESLPLLVLNLHRPYRYEPRVRKRRPKQYPLMQTPRKELRKLLAHNTDVD